VGNSGAELESNPNFRPEQGSCRGHYEDGEGGKQKGPEGQKGQKELFALFALLALFASLLTIPSQNYLRRRKIFVTA